MKMSCHHSSWQAQGVVRLRRLVEVNVALTLIGIRVSAAVVLRGETAWQAAEYVVSDETSRFTFACFGDFDT